MEQDYRILTFDYPMEINDIEELADFVIQLIKKLEIKYPVFIGASLGGFLSQLVLRKYQNDDVAYALYGNCRVDIYLFYHRRLFFSIVRF